MASQQDKEGKAERRYLVGMVTSREFLAKASAVWKDGCFASDEANVIGGWCVEHFRKYDEPPSAGVATYLESWSEHAAADKAAAVNAVLSVVMGECEQELNVRHLLDRFDAYVRKVRLKSMATEMQRCLDIGRVDKADEIRLKYTDVCVSGSSGIDLFQDVEEMKSTYSKELTEPVVEYDGSLRKFFGRHLCRDYFVAFMGAEKIGKSYWLLDIAWRAMTQRRRVAYFQVGDLSDWQIKDRFLTRATGKPSWSTNEDGSWPCVVKTPVKIGPSLGKGKPAEVEHLVEKHAGPFHAEKGWTRHIARAVRELTKSERSYFKLWCWPTKTASVNDLKGILNSLELSDWPVDVVIVDYADVLAPMNPRESRIDQIKMDWEHLRQISQAHRCLVVTATQVNAKSYGKELLDRSNFSGNHLKLAEVNGMVAINVNPAEKKLNLCRLNWIGRREGNYAVGRPVHVAQCLALSNAAVMSVYPRQAKEEES